MSQQPVQATSPHRALLNSADTSPIRPRSGTSGWAWAGRAEEESRPSAIRTGGVRPLDPPSSGPGLVEATPTEPKANGPPEGAASGSASSAVPILICLLGSFRVLERGRPVVLREGGKAEVLLSALALRPGQDVSHDTLLEEIWTDGDSALAAQSLKSLIYSPHKLFQAALDSESPIPPSGFTMSSPKPHCRLLERFPNRQRTRPSGIHWEPWQHDNDRRAFPARVSIAPGEPLLMLRAAEPDRNDADDGWRQEKFPPRLVILAFTWSQAGDSRGR